MPKKRETRILTAKKIITINPDQPYADAVAIKDGHILAVGDVGSLSARFPGAHIDNSLAEKVLIPGLIDAHCHMQLEGLFWNHAWVGYFDRTAPDGKSVPGIHSVTDVIYRLKEVERHINKPNVPVVGWGYDPILLNDQILTKKELDQVSTTRPVIVFNTSGHIIYVNSSLLNKAGITSETNITGVIKDSAGNPTGELEELEAMLLAIDFVPDLLTAATSTTSIMNGAKLAQHAGCTTASELACFMGPAFDAYKTQTSVPDFPVRVAVSPLASAMLNKQSPNEMMAYLDDVSRDLPEKLFLGPVKWIVDGSIQGYTADLMWPGYCGSHANPILETPFNQLRKEILPFHEAGYQLAIHVNGDGATEIALNAIEDILDRSPRWDHRHRLEHCQVASRSQFERIANLGMCVNLFSNHIYFWGDEHCAKTFGPDKALRMDAAATALSLGIHFSMHSDSPVTPIAPLFSAWCAVNRATLSGIVLGKDERISIEDGLAAVTLGAAYLLRRDGDLGSIEVGKLADFTILDEDPLSVPAIELKDIPIWGTVLNGNILPVKAA